jgi:arylsulfatase A-like enzyme
LKDVGCETDMVGKWHLGHADRKYWPQNRGFDHFYGNLVGEVDYFTKERGGIIDWQRDGKFLKEDGYFTTLIGNEDTQVGRVVAALKQKNLLDNTLIIFSSDN